MILNDFFKGEQMANLEKYCPVEDAQNPNSSPSLCLEPSAYSEVLNIPSKRIEEYCKAIANILDIEVKLYTFENSKRFFTFSPGQSSENDIFNLIFQDIERREKELEKEKNELENAKSTCNSLRSIESRRNKYKEKMPEKFDEDRK